MQKFKKEMERNNSREVESQKTAKNLNFSQTVQLMLNNILKTMYFQVVLAAQKHISSKEECDRFIVELGKIFGKKEKK